MSKQQTKDVTPQIEVNVAQKQPQVVKAIVSPMSNFQAKPGEYHMVRLDKNGNEIPGSDFSLAERTYERTYKALTNKYKVKKNPQ